ncbi:MAG: DEAD/DEAH box helicase, partial [Verrucomicrobiales bacterium]|nr:DEAD/DEAH box helicase [Verrucomicrobiales bacterium]
AVPILGLDATGWIGSLLGASEDDVSMPDIQVPESFQGELRPYQHKGLSWLAFLDRLGLGPCLADDMGLGKTIQLLALLLYERQLNNGESPGPTILVVPMSIVGNWQREAHRFAPDLTVLVHHGPERLTGDSFAQSASTSDLVITTYALVNRDLETLEKVGWRRAVLDEAQNIKNPSAKQTRAVRALAPERRVALTGTPLENRLSELWSIMEFCNPGFLGTLTEFKRAFALPIERHNDRQRATRLRNLVRPFILRRLKTDPNVIEELPEKVESREYCRLTSEQAELYESTVRKMLTEVEQAEGIRRRGAVLAALTRLKQICDHPWLVRPDKDDGASPPTSATTSGKCIRLLEMLDEVVASGDQALVFTQFRQMGRVLASTISHALDRDVLFLHGGTTQTQRQQMVDRFQLEDGSAPIFILSLKAGGVGLNLTAASHVFHFDRWWNPAVENQATDRAYRIGQTKRVQVHKFIVAGTLEERIDQMIESKIALAEDVIGSGEDWLTELSTNQLKELFSLRPDAIAD